MRAYDMLTDILASWVAIGNPTGHGGYDLYHAGAFEHHFYTKAALDIYVGYHHDADECVMTDQAVHYGLVGLLYVIRLDMRD